MSLSVYLNFKETVTKPASSGVFIRENGRTKEITMEEWNEKFPGKELVKFDGQETETGEVYCANITHNLNSLAKAVEIYYHIWRPEEIGITKASEIIEPLKAGIEKMKAEPEKYKKFSAENGWGTYEQFVPWVERYLNACIEYPDAEIEVSR